MGQLIEQESTAQAPPRDDEEHAVKLEEERTGGVFEGKRNTQAPPIPEEAVQFVNDDVRIEV